jgi:hypothetical protein
MSLELIHSVVSFRVPYHSQVQMYFGTVFYIYYIELHWFELFCPSFPSYTYVATQRFQRDAINVMKNELETGNALSVMAVQIRGLFNTSCRLSANVQRLSTEDNMMFWAEEVSSKGVEQSRVRVTLRLTISLSVLVSSPRRPHISHCLRVTVLSFGGRLLWREDGSVVCQSQSAVISRLSVCTTILHFAYFTWYLFIQGLCQSGLGTADYALFLVAFATTAV